MASTSGRVNSTEYEVKRRKVSTPITSDPSVFYVTKKTNVASQSQKIQDALLNKANEVTVYGMGASLNRALVLVLNVSKLFNGAIVYDMKTTTVQVTDDLFPYSDEYEALQRDRPLSAVKITLSHIAS